MDKEQANGAQDSGDTELIEKLADYAHEAWSGWMKYMFDKGAINGFWQMSEAEAIGWTMPKELYQRWLRQSLTPYADLPESEKESDRKEARAILAIIEGKEKSE